MLEFPNIMRPSYSMGVASENISLISQFEDGSQQSRVKYTKSRKKYKIKWNSLPNADYETLNDFIVNQCKFSALPFMWTNPQAKGVDPVIHQPIYETVEVRITGGFESWELVNVTYWQGELEFTEV